MCVGADVWVHILFGPNFAPAALALRVLAVANLLMYVSIVCAYALAVSNQPWRMTAVFAGGMLVNPACNFLLIRPSLSFGLGGGGAACATATLVTEVGVVVPLMAMLGRRVLGARLVVRALKNFAVAGGVIVLDSYWLRPWGWKRLPLEAVIYCALVLLIGAVNLRELVDSLKMAIEQRRNKGATPPVS
jgi:O-antigen/teichoic acid export membrane protein